MAKCDEGYICQVCGRAVEDIAESDLYLRFVMGLVDPEVLHTAAETHIRCNPVLAQFIVSDDFEKVSVMGDFDKRVLDPGYVSKRELLTTRAWQRLNELSGKEIPIVEYPLPEVRAKFAE